MRVFEAVIEEILASKGNIEFRKKLEIMCDKLDALIATAQEASHFFLLQHVTFWFAVSENRHTHCKYATSESEDFDWAGIK